MESHYGVCTHNIHANISSLSQLKSMDKTLTEIVFDTGCAAYENVKRLNLSGYKQVTRIVIGNHSFKKVEELVLEGLPKVTELEIGDGCFSYQKEVDDGEKMKKLLGKGGWGWGDDDSDENPYVCPYEELPRGMFRVAKCRALKKITIGGCSFNNYLQFRVEELPALETLTIGSRDPKRFCGCFFHAKLNLEGSWRGSANDQICLR